MGPLDTLHWEQRSYLRMAHNAGNRGLAVLAASAGFVAVRDLAGAGSHPTMLALAVGVAAACFAAVDLLLSVTLLLLQGESRRAAARHVLAIDALTFPVALYGAATGFLAGPVGWWATALALVPAAFVPELVLARARWRATVVRDVVLGLAAVVLLVAVALVAPVPDPATLAVLVAVAVLAGAELAADARAAIPPLLAVVVVAAVVVTGGDGAYCAAALVAGAGTATACWGSGRRSRPRFAGAMATAAGAGLLAAAVYEAAPHSVSGVALAALGAGLTFELVAVLAGAARRRRGAHTRSGPHPSWRPRSPRRSGGGSWVAEAERCSPSR